MPPFGDSASPTERELRATRLDFIDVDSAADTSTKGAANQSAPNFRHDRYDWGGHAVFGGMGIVLRVHDKHLHRDLALKILKSELSMDESAYERFIEEAQICGQLQHPGIVPIHDVDRLDDGRVFFTMKWVEGKTLAAEIRHGERSTSGSFRFVELFEQLCQAVGYAHARGVVHRDLKPSNVMVGAFGEVQVMDWGIAKIVSSPSSPSDVRTIRHAGTAADEILDHDDDQHHGVDDPSGNASSSRTRASSSWTRASHVIGTVAYMSPEQASGKHDRVDARSDVFSLGAILAEIVTGVPPYPNAPGSDAHFRAVRCELSDCLDRIDQSHVSEFWKGLAKQCLAVDPGERYTDAGQIADVIREYRDQSEKALRQEELNRAALGVRLEQAQQTLAAERRHRRYKMIVIVTATALLASVAIGWFFVKEYQARAELVRLDAEFTRRERQQNDRQRFRGIADRMREEFERIERSDTIPDRSDLEQLTALDTRVESACTGELRTFRSIKEETEELLQKSQLFVSLARNSEQFLAIGTSVPIEQTTVAELAGSATEDQRLRAEARQYERQLQTNWQIEIDNPKLSAKRIALLPTWASTTLRCGLQGWLARLAWTNQPANRNLASLCDLITSDLWEHQVFEAIRQRNLGKLASLATESDAKLAPDEVVLAMCDTLIRFGATTRAGELDKALQWIVCDVEEIDFANQRSFSLVDDGWIVIDEAIAVPDIYTINLHVSTESISAIRLETRKIPRTGTEVGQSLPSTPVAYRGADDDIHIENIQVSRRGSDLQIRRSCTSHKRIASHELSLAFDDSDNTFWQLSRHGTATVERTIFEFAPQTANVSSRMSIEIKNGTPFLRSNTTLDQFRLSVTSQDTDAIVDYEAVAISLLDHLAVRRPESSRLSRRLAQYYRLQTPPDMKSALALASAAIAAQPYNAASVSVMAELVLGDIDWQTVPTLEHTAYQRLLKHIDRIEEPVARDKLILQLSTFFVELGRTSIDNRPELAIMAFEEAYRLNARQFSQHLPLANLYVKFRQFEQAEKLFELAVARSPDDPEVYFGEGSYWLIRGRPQRAVKSLKIASSLRPDDPRFLLAYTKCLMQTGDTALGNHCLCKLRDVEALDNRTLRLALLGFAAANQKEMLRDWTQWLMTDTQAPNTKWTPETWGCAAIAMAFVDQVKSFWVLAVESELATTDLLQSMVKAVDRLLMARRDDGEPRVESPEIGRRLLQDTLSTIGEVNGLENELRSLRCRLIVTLWCENENAKASSVFESLENEDAVIENGLIAAISVLTKTQREDWAELPANQLPTDRFRSLGDEDRDFADWLWWEFRVDQTAGQSWRGWRR